jgi:hypothetical protein
MNIRYLKREEIDKVKWNSCVHYATNGNIFGYMWYLDFVGKDWDALVEGDYESVFPLVWRDGFFGKKELYQPHLMRELGVYSINVLSQARVRKFIEAIPEEFNKIDITLNEQNLLSEKDAYKKKKHINHQMLLSAPYEELADNFSRELLLTLEKAEDYRLRPVSNLKPEKIANFYLQHTKDGKGKEQKFHAMQRVMYNVLHRGWGFATGVANEQDELIAVNFLIYSHKKVLNFMPVTSKEGEEKGALAYMINMLFRSHAGRPQIFDFNTKEVDELAKGFGAQSNPYYRLKVDKRKWIFF